ncbi:RNA recognition motif domain-containing protein [Ditylenchus destructor]|uniref:RNA recognition motif domain-containing protein n=1 Tax=Ditylenchus destructor TaxID=166010 RepID=A0AAD4RAV4_9BILA|nr:RNA recognition motif domain-containing protein [Ditylenchus destructor]
MDWNINHRGPGIKSWRLIIRNLPFDTKEEEVTELASKFGRIKELRLPKCKDKKFPDSCAGFCFVQYSGRKEAAEAKEQLNFTQFKSRKVAVDWALDKDTYMTKTLEGGSQKNVKRTSKQRIVFQEDDKMETVDASSGDEEVDVKKEIKEEVDEPSDDGCSSDGEADIKDEIKEEVKDPEPKRREDIAVTEGRVVFLRNLDFDTTNEDVKEEAEKYGKVSLAIMCKYKQTDQATGTAFVHFAEKESADKFLDQLVKEDGVLLKDRRVYGHRALPKSDAESLKKNAKKQPKDKRNLHLLKASLIRSGTAQARDMSETDGQMRQKLASVAKTKLKNLHMFVSPTRLAIHNIPFAYTDEQFRQVCLDRAKGGPGKNVHITECRIMREKKGKDAKGRIILGRSKGFGFVEFDTHTNALTCLRTMNNNPEVFTNERRPIVEFAIENLQALRLKERRRVGSKGGRSSKKS